MSPEAQRIAIARACPLVARIDGAGAPVWVSNSREYFDPLTDLNAMHEVEKMLTLPQCLAMTHRLGEMEVKHISSPLKATRFTWHATAAHRAEAFLRTINKWDDSK